MKISRVAIVALAAIAASLVWTQGRTKLSEQGEALGLRIGKLRSLADDVRSKETMALALEIRKLSSAQDRVLLGGSLCNLATEGDFGHDTLQEVANTLSEAVAAAPPADVNGEPAYAYTQLASLARYEDIKVNLTGDAFNKAMAKLAKLDDIRGNADFTLTDLNGKTWTRSALKGKVVLVNFWATWCPPCRKEMPDLQALYNEFKDKGLVILAISDETLDKVEPFVKEHKYSYPIMLDPSRKVNELFQVDGIPKNFVYGRDGKLAAQAIDMRTRGQFLKMLAKAGLK